MRAYTVTVTFAPVVDDDWSALYNLLDVLPGSFIIEDSEAPTAVIVVDAETKQSAFTFVDGVFKVLGLRPRTGKFELFQPAEGISELLDDEYEETESVPTGEVKGWDNALVAC